MPVAGFFRRQPEVDWVGGLEKGRKCERQKGKGKKRLILTRKLPYDTHTKVEQTQASVQRSAKKNQKTDRTKKRSSYVGTNFFLADYTYSGVVLHTRDRAKCSCREINRWAEGLGEEELLKKAWGGSSQDRGHETGRNKKTKTHVPAKKTSSITKQRTRP